MLQDVMLESLPTWATEAIRDGTLEAIRGDLQRAADELGQAARQFGQELARREASYSAE